MRRLRIAQQALSLAAQPSQRQHICEVCLARAARQIHTSVPRNAKLSFLKSLRDSVFGSRKAEENKDTEDIQPKEVVDASPKEKKVKGQIYQIAPSVVPSTESEYIPVSRWDRLEHVGSLDWVEKQAVKGKVYTGYLSSTPSTLDNARWRKLLHRVAVETLAGVDKERVAMTGSRRIVVHNGEAHLEDIPAETKGLGSMYEKDENEIPSWMKWKLTDPKIKFAVVKRVMQLTNRRIPDYVVSQSSTMADLYKSLKAKEQPKRLIDAEEVKKLRTSMQIPNVAIYPTRRTPVHKEKQVGRWKVIKEELRSRDLPVLGSRRQGEKEYLYPM